MFFFSVRNHSRRTTTTTSKEHSFCVVNYVSELLQQRHTLSFSADYCIGHRPIAKKCTWRLSTLFSLFLVPLWFDDDRHGKHRNNFTWAGRNSFVRCEMVALYGGGDAWLCATHAESSLIETWLMTAIATQKCLTKMCMHCTGTHWRDRERWMATEMP